MALTHRAQGDKSEKKRPRGRAPKGCVWSYEEHMFVPNEVEAQLAGVTMTAAAEGVVVLQTKKPKAKRTMWHEQGDVMKQAIEEVFKRSGDVCGALKHLKYSCPLIYDKLAQGTLDGWYTKARADPIFRRSPAQCTSSALRRGGRDTILSSSQLTTLMVALRESVSSGVRVGSVLLINRAIAVFREQKWHAPLHPKIGSKYQIDGCKGTLHLCQQWINALCTAPPDGGRPLTMRQPSQAKYHLPDDHAEQFNELLLRSAYRVQAHSIPRECVIAGDETSTLLFAMGNGKGRCEKGAKDNARVGADEKRAITVMITVSAAGDMLQLQFIWQGKTQACTPWKHIKDDPILNKHLHSFSKSHWSTPVTIYELVEKVYAPYLMAKNVALGRDKHAVSLLIWDVYYAHRDEGMRSLMRQNVGWISVDYILARGTSKYQPGDQPEINNSFKMNSKQEGDVWLAEKLTNLSAEHEGKIPGQAVLKLLQKSTLGPALRLSSATRRAGFSPVPMVTLRNMQNQTPSRNLSKRFSQSRRMRSCGRLLFRTSSRA
jgi:hypothetical protein